MESNFIISICILVMSVVIHELSHGYVALMYGDMTPKLQGRLTINPLKHLDILGSIIVPIFTLLLGAGVFGWAKPVEVNPHNFKDKRWGEFWVSLAGPLSNIALAVGFSIILHAFRGVSNIPFIAFLITVIYTNVILAIFNLMPIPPLDGSKIIFTLFPRFFAKHRAVVERYYIFIAIIFVFFIWQLISPVVNKITMLLLN